MCVKIKKEKENIHTCGISPTMGRCLLGGRHCLKLADREGCHDPAQHTVLTVQCLCPLYNHWPPLCFVPVCGDEEKQYLKHIQYCKNFRQVNSLQNSIRFYYIYLPQITDEEFLASLHFFLVTLCQVVKICKLVERRVEACEWRGSWQQQWVERDQLPHIQLTLPANIKGRVTKKWGN